MDTQNDVWAVYDTVQDMTRWLAEQRRTGTWSPVWETVAGWRDELTAAITGETA